MTVPFDHWIVATHDGREGTMAALVVHDRAVIISGGLIIDTMKSVANAKLAAEAVNAKIDRDAGAPLGLAVAIAVGKQHQVTSFNVNGQYCAKDAFDWPCDAAQLAAALEAVLR